MLPPYSPAKGCAWAVQPHVSAEEHKTSHGCPLPHCLGKDSSKGAPCGLWSIPPSHQEVTPTSSLSPGSSQLATSLDDLNNLSTHLDQSNEQHLPTFTHPCSGFMGYFAAKGVEGTGPFLHLTPGFGSLEGVQLAGALHSPGTRAHVLWGTGSLLGHRGSWAQPSALISRQ